MSTQELCFLQAQRKKQRRLSLRPSVIVSRMVLSAPLYDSDRFSMLVSQVLRNRPSRIKASIEGVRDE